VSDPHDLLLTHLADIEVICRRVCRTRQMSPDEIEEFSAEVKLRLVENDYAILRHYQGRSTFLTFITAVVVRLLRDYRNHQWGKWHSSAEAQRLGPLAVELERMVRREGRTIDDAAPILLSQHPGATRADLERIMDRLPPRIRRRIVPLEQAAVVPIANDVENIDHVETASRISAIIRRFIEALPKQDRLVFQLRFEVAMPVAQIARSLGLDVGTLYRRLYKHFDALRTALTQAGISSSEVEKLIGTDAPLDFRLKGEDIHALNDEDDAGAYATREKP
jgi:RNA polymerase sigma factor (sigma-70 family)